jgi:hypothetical protein
MNMSDNDNFASLLEKADISEDPVKVSALRMLSEILKMNYGRISVAAQEQGFALLLKLVGKLLLLKHIILFVF